MAMENCGAQPTLRPRPSQCHPRQHAPLHYIWPTSDDFGLVPLVVHHVRHQYPYRAVWHQYRALRTIGCPTESVKGSDEDPKVFSDREETALVAYVTELERVGVTAAMIRSAGSKILANRRFHLVPLKWYSDWVQKHPGVRPSTTKPVPLKDITYDTKVEEIKQ
ncbi:hypothetical protein PspLS_10475 [Pyricularia sp. CBS 133598]|nr:hypothetical protein PspLS_10475 [Pyricularia sp. CBS 133598]